MTPATDNFTIKSLVAIVAMLVMVASSQAQTMDRVELKSIAQSDDNLVQLREIAWLTGDTATKLGGSIVTTLSENQVDSRITLQSVRKHLSDMGVNWGRFNLTGASQCQVTLASAQPTRTAIVPNPSKPIHATDAISIEEYVTRYLLTYTGLSDQELVLSFSAADKRELSAAALTDRFEIEVIGTAKIGQIPMVIRRWRGGSMVGEIRVTAQVTCKTLAAVVVENVRRGQSFGPNDVQVQEVFLTSPQTPIRKLRDVVGRIASRNIRKNQTLFESDVQLPFMIQRGEQVTVRVMVGSMVIRTVARANTDAAMGEMVELQNQRSRESFMARVTGPRQAVLDNGSSQQVSMAGGGSR
ncbi:MAG TPA: flagella basal body P-ring formation protein FlgA [Phycisphaerales bacterium]|nr:flagella basal body P-ring formation protein FlgA [Phycisphaerales bacterium]|tara:strand:+ start:49833 stop:50897 length:1065 start_codon:yes stop_codon:yes gene_type:complete